MKKILNTMLMFVIVFATAFLVSAFTKGKQRKPQTEARSNAQIIQSKEVHLAMLDGNIRIKLGKIERN